MKKVSLMKKIAYIFDHKQRIQLIIIGIMILISGALETVSLSALVPMLGILMDPGKLEAYVMEYDILKKLCDFFNLVHMSQVMQAFIVVIIIVYVVKALYILWLTYKQNTFITRTRNKMISRVMREFLNRPYEEYLGADIPTVFRLTDSDIPQTFSLVLALLQLASEVVVSGLLFVWLLSRDIVMTLFIVLIFGGMTLLLSRVMKPRLNTIGKKNQAIQSRIAKWRIQAIYGLKDVKVLNREEFFIRNYYESGRIGADVARNYAVLNNTPRLFIETIFIVCILLFISIYTGGNPDTSMGDTLLTFGIAAIRIMPSANRINTYITEIAYMQPSLDYLYENLQHDMKTDKPVTAAAADQPAKPALTLQDKIELKNITFAYPGTDKNIFKDACMSVPKGKSVGIMGVSGAGKSTIVDILLGLLHAQEGAITCDGKDIFSNYEAWLAQIGYIPQSIYLIDESIRDNIAFGIDADKIDEERLNKVLEEAQLKEFVDELPEGLDTTIGDRGVRISGGQRQRIGIARALYHDPEILVFDEATSALDNDTEQAVMDAINNFHGKKTMIIIAHRLNTIEKCDIIYKVADEKLIEATI